MASGFKLHGAPNFSFMQAASPSPVIMKATTAMPNPFSDGASLLGQELGRRIASMAGRLGERIFKGGTSGGYARSSANAQSRYESENPTVIKLRQGGTKTLENGVANDSTCVQSYSYYPGANDMDITFRGGKGTRYTYHNVTPAVWEGFNKANSKGQFVNHVLKHNTWQLGEKPKDKSNNRSKLYMQTFEKFYNVNGHLPKR